jgi:hypothetical protein
MGSTTDYRVPLNESTYDELTIRQHPCQAPSGTACHRKASPRLLAECRGIELREMMHYRTHEESPDSNRRDFMRASAE